MRKGIRNDQPGPRGKEIIAGSKGPQAPHQKHPRPEGGGLGVGQINSHLLTKTGCHSFTLIELITVIAIGAVLMAMILPLASGARRQYAIAQTRAQMHRYSLGLEQFRAQYDSYPDFGVAGPVPLKDHAEFFVEVLTGRAIDGGTMKNKDARDQNPKSLRFLEFKDDELASDGLLRDAFGQTDLELFFDADNDGFLDTLPSVRGSLGWRSNGNPTITSWQ